MFNLENMRLQCLIFIYDMVRGGVLLAAVAIDYYSPSYRHAALDAQRAARIDAQI